MTGAGGGPDWAAALPLKQRLLWSVSTRVVELQVEVAMTFASGSGSAPFYVAQQLSLTHSRRVAAV